MIILSQTNWLIARLYRRILDKNLWLNLRPHLMIFSRSCSLICSVLKSTIQIRIRILVCEILFTILHQVREFVFVHLLPVSRPQSIWLFESLGRFLWFLVHRCIIFILQKCFIVLFCSTSREFPSTHWWNSLTGFVCASV